MNDSEKTLLDGISGRLFIGGEWVDATGGATLAVRDPATNDVIARVADATADDATAALDAAVAAQDEWAATSPRRRSDILRRAWELVQERKED
ncbi:aldehyde dehydrogenase family protein, partial [Microbacterium sp.]|uniref:aldehyde dehydrogenase family protein n=1 Tax=Microbacterium sp. TaxID=51671 RepID=UPI003F9AA789